MVPEEACRGTRALCLCAGCSHLAGTALPSLLSCIKAETKPLLQVSAWKVLLGSASQEHPNTSQNAEELSFSTVEVPVFHTDSSCTTSQGTGQCSQSPWYRGHSRGFAQKMYSFIDFTGHVNALHMSSLKSLVMRVHGSQQKICL